MWQIFMKPPAARIPVVSFEDGPLEKSPHETCSPWSFIVNLWWLWFNTETFRAFRTVPFLALGNIPPGNIPGEMTVILKGAKVKTRAWCRWAVCWSCFAPTKDHDTGFAGLVEVGGFLGAGAWPPKSNCSWVRWWAEVLWATQEDPCYLQVPDRSSKLHEILQQRLQLPPGTWQTSRTLQQLKSVRVANCSSASPGTYELFQLHQRSL